MTKVTVSETTYSITVAEETVNVTVADASETIQVQIASGASDIQVISTGDTNSLISSTAGVVTTLKTLTAGDNVTLSDDGNTITVSATEDDLSNNTTDNLAEGSNNLYYTDARVQTKLGSVSGHIIPDTDNTYDLGSTDSKWRSLYLSGGSLYIEGQKVVGSTDGTIDFTTDDGENINIFAGANGPAGDIILNSASGVTRLEGTDIRLNPVGSGKTTVRGTLEAPDLHVGDLEFDASGMTQTGLNQNLTLKSNGNGFVYVETSDLYVGNVLTTAVKIDENSISGYNTTVTFTGNLTGDVTGTVSDISNHTTTALTEGTNLYYTDARVNTLLGTKGYATETYVDTEISNLVDTAPETLNTLNELAAALGDDANFSTTVTNSIATKWTQDNTKISNWDTAYSWGDHSTAGYLTSFTETDPIYTASSWYTTTNNSTNWNTAYSWGNHADEGYLTSYTETDPTVPAHVKSITSTNISNWNTAYGWGDHSTQGYLTDYTVTQADVTQHQAALSITESQISDLDHYTDADARNAISLNSTNLNELSYDSATGAFSYTSPSTVAATGQVVFEVRNASGVAISRGDAVYIAGHSGGKILVAKSDANDYSTMPAIGLANSAMSNNSDGTVLVAGEMTSIDTSAFSVGDVLYVSETAGELTATRPSAETTRVQNIGKVARSDNQNGIIIVSGSGRANDVPNLAHGHVFIGNNLGYETRALDTSDVAEDSSNLYYTDARARAAISASGDLSYNSSTGVISFTETPQDFAYTSLTGAPTNVSHFTNDAGYLTSYTETDPIYTASSWYSTTNNSANWNTAYSWGDHSIEGYITDYTVTQNDVTQHQAALSITESQISDLTHYTDSDAISAIENEATLDLTGALTVDGNATVDSLFKINDGFTLGSFNPYYMFGAPAMPTAFAGVGQEGGWAGMGVRSRGIHDFGIGSQYNFPPNAILALQSGRLDGSDNDDYLNNDDYFGQVQFNAYSGYRTGTEWITPSAVIEARATEDHSASGMGTKLVLRTTENGNSAGAQDSLHTNADITIQGTTVTTSGTLKLDDDVVITGTTEFQGNLSSNGTTITVEDNLKVQGSDVNSTVVVGDESVSGGLYDVHGFTVKAGDTRWSTVTLDEHVGGADKPLTSFSNPVLVGQVWGGTPESQAAVGDGKRLITIAGQGSYDDNGTITQPPSSPIRIVGETTEAQTSSARGARFQIETTPNGSTSRTAVRFQGDEVTINPGGNGTLKSGGTLTLDDAVVVEETLNVKGTSDFDSNVNMDGNLDITGTLTVDGNATFGNANTDVITMTGGLVCSNGLTLTNLNTATAQYLVSISAVNTGGIAYITDGDSGNPCVAVFDGTSFKRIALGSSISSS